MNKFTSLIPGNSKKVISRNIEKLVLDGRSQKQAVEIALSNSKHSKKRKLLISHNKQQ